MEVLDQKNASGSTGIGFGDTGNGRDYMVQGFIPTLNNITAVSFQLNSLGSAGMRIWIDEVDANSKPINGIGGIGGSTEITNANLSTSLKKYALSLFVALSPGRRYGIVFAPWNTSTHTWTAEYRDVPSSTGNPYSRGRRVHLDSGFANPSAPDSGNDDILFETYGEIASFKKYPALRPHIFSPGLAR